MLVNIYAAWSFPISLPPTSDFLLSSALRTEDHEAYSDPWVPVVMSTVPTQGHSEGSLYPAYPGCRLHSMGNKDCLKLAFLSTLFSCVLPSSEKVLAYTMFTWRKRMERKETYEKGKEAMFFQYWLNCNILWCIKGKTAFPSEVSNHTEALTLQNKSVYTWSCFISSISFTYITYAKWNHPQDDCNWADTSVFLW